MVRLTGKVLMTLACLGLAGSSPAADGGAGDPPKARLAVRMHVATPALVEVVIGGQGLTEPTKGEPAAPSTLRVETEKLPDSPPTAAPASKAPVPVASSPAAAPAEAPAAADLLLQARAASRDGNWPESLAAYRQVLQVVPQHPERDLITLETAAVLENLGQEDEALQLYDRLLAGTLAPPLLGRARLGRSTLIFHRQIQSPDPVAAFSQYRRELASLDQFDHWNPADRVNLKRWEVQAWEHLMTALKSHPELPVARLEEVMTLWDQSPTDNRPRTAAGFWADRLYRAGLLGEATRFYQTALENCEAPARSLLWTRWVDSLRELGDWRQLEKVLSSWRQETGGLPPRLAAELGRVQLLNGSVAEAAATLEAALSQDEAAQFPENWLALAQAHQQLQDDPQAIRVLERALLRPLPQETLQKQLAALYDRAGRYDQAALIYQKLLEPASPADRGFFLERLGVCYTKTQQYSQAHQIFRELAHSGDYFWQKLAQAHLQGLSVYPGGIPGVN